MKKTSLLGISLFAALAVSAQVNVLKDVDHMMKGSSPDYAAALNTIKPALTNSETSENVQAWYLAGKAGFGLFDQMYLKQNMGNELSNAEKQAAGQGMIDAYGYYFQALPLDSLPDAKGKVKPKYSKEMLKTLKDNYASLKTAGIYLFEINDYDGAYDAWELYANLPNNPILGKERPTSDPDSLVGQIMYYQLLAALSADEDAKALAKGKQMLGSGYQTLDAYRYTVEAARRLNDTIALVEISQQAYDKFGTEDISFIGQLINAKLNAQDYANSLKLVNEAIAATPAENTPIVCQLYDIIGYIYEQQNDNANAGVNFRKAIEVDPSFAKGYYDLGRVIYNDAVTMDENNDGSVETQAVIDKLLEAAQLFEQAFEMDEDNMTNVPGILYRLYYRLGPGYESQAKKWENM